MEGPDRPPRGSLYTEQQAAATYGPKKSTLAEVNRLPWEVVQGWEQNTSQYQVTLDLHESHGRENKRKTSVFVLDSKKWSHSPLSLWCVHVCAHTCAHERGYSPICTVKLTSIHIPYWLTQYPKSAPSFHKESFGKLSAITHPKSLTGQSNPLININQSPRTIRHWRKLM